MAVGVRLAGGGSDDLRYISAIHLPCKLNTELLYDFRRFACRAFLVLATYFAPLGWLSLTITQVRTARLRELDEQFCLFRYIPQRFLFCNFICL